jgi:hypothetical protein
LLFIGNMSNPVITRLGTNQFWYKHWYSDKLFAANLHQDKSFEALIKFYLDYGLTFNSNPNVHEYWYNPSFKKYRTENAVTNLRFYRRYFYTNDIMSIEHSYFIRHFSGEYFPLRIWVMRYMNWVILCVQWFKPIKKKTKKVFVKKTKKKYTALHEYGRTNHSVNRLKVLLILFTKQLSTFSKNYQF